MVAVDAADESAPDGERPICGVDEDGCGNNNNEIYQGRPKAI